MQHRQTVVIYECDQCQKVAEATDSAASTSPSGWLTVQPSMTTQGDWFCSWECLGEWCKVRAKDRDERLTAIRARQKARQKKMAS